MPLKRKLWEIGLSVSILLCAVMAAGCTGALAVTGDWQYWNALWDWLTLFVDTLLVMQMAGIV